LWLQRVDLNFMELLKNCKLLNLKCQQNGRNEGSLIC
jgi:hypothetical protein